MGILHGNIVDGATGEQASWAFASDRPISDASEVSLRNIQFGLGHR